MLQLSALCTQGIACKPSASGSAQWSELPRNCFHLQLSQTIFCSLEKYQEAVAQKHTLYMRIVWNHRIPTFSVNRRCASLMMAGLNHDFNCNPCSLQSINYGFSLLKGTKTCSDFHKCFTERQLEFYRESLLYFQSSRNNHLFCYLVQPSPERANTNWVLNMETLTRETQNLMFTSNLWKYESKFSSPRNASAVGVGTSGPSAAPHPA